MAVTGSIYTQGAVRSDWTPLDILPWSKQELASFKAWVIPAQYGPQKAVYVDFNDGNNGHMTIQIHRDYAHLVKVGDGVDLVHTDVMVLVKKGSYDPVTHREQTITRLRIAPKAVNPGACMDKVRLNTTIGSGGVLGALAQQQPISSLEDKPIGSGDDTEASVVEEETPAEETPATPATTVDASVIDAHTTEE